jgi:hypothetical protein
MTTLMPASSTESVASAVRGATGPTSLYSVICDESGSTEAGFVHRQSESPFLGELFRNLADWWREGTQYLSSPSEIAAHVAYQRIISLGPGVIPYILEDLRDRGGDWYIALRLLATDPPRIPPETARNTRQVIQAWLDWGRDRGYAL